MTKKFGVVLCSLFFCVSVFASQAPVVMLQQASTNLLTQLSQNKTRLKNNSALLDQIVKQTVIPYIDLNMMSRMVVGRQYWDAAGSAQQKSFEQEFARYVTRTYAAAFENYNNEKVLFYPIRGGVSNQTRVTVNSKIQRQSGPDVPMSYLLYRQGNNWRVYDISVEGVSMVQSYRSQFSNVLAQKGLTGLISDLRTHNRRN